MAGEDVQLKHQKCKSITLSHLTYQISLQPLDQSGERWFMWGTITKNRKHFVTYRITLKLHHANFQLLTLIYRWDMYETRLRTREYQKTHLRSLLNLHAKFQFTKAQFSERATLGTAIFQSVNGVKSPPPLAIFLCNKNRGMIFEHVIHILIFHQLVYRRYFCPLNTNSTNFEHYRILTQSRPRHWQPT